MKKIKPNKRKLTSANRRHTPDFPIIGIGSSAGGLEAIEELVSNLPPNPGIAVVIVQHLDPTHASLTTEILARKTKMNVTEARNGALIGVDHIYVIPPNADLTIKGGRLQVSVRSKARGLRLPIDAFFKSLALTRKKRAIGVVLSGTGSDGTEGLKLIKAKGGLTIAQKPRSAKHDGMPTSAISSNAVDFVFTPKEIAKKLARIAQSPSSESSRRQETPNRLVRQSENSKNENPESASVARILELLRSSCEIDFSHYKKTTLQRRIQRRMILLKKESAADYLAFIQENPEETKELLADLLINVTAFFRDPSSYEDLEKLILPAILKNKNANEPIRIWVVGCATGEEAYSVAISLLEHLGPQAGRTPIQIFATDVSESSIQKARLGVYPESISQSVSPERLSRYFAKSGSGYKIHKSVRDLIVFSRHDVTKDPPFAKLDLVCCRNLFIYFELDLQRSVLHTLHFALTPSGILWVGRSEAVAGLSSLFTLKYKGKNFYSRTKRPTPLHFKFPANRFITETLPASTLSVPSKSMSIDGVRERATLESVARYAPPSVVVNSEMEIILSEGDTSPFIHLPRGEVSLNLFKMAQPEIVADLRMAIQTVRKTSSPSRKNDLVVRNGERTTHFNINVRPLELLPENDSAHFIVFFEPLTEPIGLAKKRSSSKSKTGKVSSERSGIRIRELEQKLAETKAYQISLAEDFETTREQLAATNEELQSANEELQSTNEELETAKEELQSTNEELTTVNEELQNRNQELGHVNNDLINLLGSVNIAIVIVGLDKSIRRFTPAASKTLNLIQSDIGRPIGDIKPCFDQCDISALVAEVISSVSIIEREIQDREGRWFRVQARPYITTENKLDGVVVALFDINHLKLSLTESQRLLARSESIANSIRLPLVVLDSRLMLRSANRSYNELFDKNSGDSGQDVFSSLGVLGDISVVKKSLLRVFDGHTEAINIEAELTLPKIGKRILLFNAHKIEWTKEIGDAALLSIEDISDRRRNEAALIQSEQRFRELVEGAHDSIVCVNAEGKIEFANNMVGRSFGYQPNQLLGQPIEALIPDSFRQIQIGQKRGDLNDGPSRPMGVGLELHARKKDGTEFPIEISLSQSQTSSGVTVTAIIRDVSYRKEAESERERLLTLEQDARAEAETANRTKDAFLATLSHELRTPMTSILSWAQLIKRSGFDSAKVRHGVDTIEQSAKAQSQLIGDLLDVSRIQSGKLALNFEAVDPREVVNRAIESVRPTADAKNVKLEAGFSLGSERIWADPNRLQQIVWNLLTNAIKFSAKGGSVRVRGHRQEGSNQAMIAIEVIDLGKGIKPEFLPLLFKRFTQADSTSTRLHGGLGLGLAIVSDLCRLMGGAVSAESEGLGKGATFTVILPVRVDEKFQDDELSARDHRPSSTGSSVDGPDLSGLRVLVIDDEPSALEVMGETLRSFGAEITACSSAHEALAAFKSWRPDVLVSDIAMPGEDGHSLVRQIRSLSAASGGQTPALALTAYACEEDIRQAKLSGFSAHMAKPFDTLQLAQVVSGLARNRID